jgi:hypothetical protein
MKTIQIPAPARAGETVDYCLRVPFHCRVVFQFTEAGLFACSGDSDDFRMASSTRGRRTCLRRLTTRLMSNGGSRRSTIKHPVVTGTLLVDTDASCSDMIETPCPDSQYANPLAP